MGTPDDIASVAAAASQDGSRKWWTLGVVCVATFMLLLDVTIVNVALPVLAKSLKATFSDLQWVIDAYALTLAAFLLTAGSLSDLFGRRLVFVLGLIIFTISSALCGFATSPIFLDVARGLQGTGGALMFATSLALLAQEFRAGDRGTALGIWGAATGIAVAIGPLIGGALTDGFGWEAIFFVNVPIGVAVILVSVKKLVNLRGAAAAIDWAGLVTFSVALFALIFGLVRGNDEGWSSPLIVALLTASAVLLAAFIVIEQRSRAPMLRLALFRIPTFDGASVVAFGLSASLFSMFLYIVLWLQTILGFSPLQAGLRLLPITIVQFVVSPIAGRLSSRIPLRALLGGGLALVGVGLLLMQGVDAHSSWTALIPGFVLAGIGNGLVNPPLASAAVGVVRPEQSGMASGINTTFRQLGTATGIAALGAIFQHQIRTHVVSALASTPIAAHATQFANLISAGGTGQLLANTPLSSRRMLHDVAAGSLTSALNEIFLISGTLALVGAAVAFALVRQKDIIAPVEGVPAA